MHFYKARFVEEILPNIKLDLECFTDGKGLYDAVNTKIIGDKKLHIEMVVLREMVEKDVIKLEWIKKDDQIACLTKKRASCELLIEALEKGTIPWLHNSNM